MAAARSISYSGSRRSSSRARPGEARELTDVLRERDHALRDQRERSVALLGPQIVDDAAARAEDPHLRDGRDASEREVDAKDLLERLEVDPAALGEHARGDDRETPDAEMRAHRERAPGSARRGRRERTLETEQRSRDRLGARVAERGERELHELPGAGAAVRVGRQERRGDVLFLEQSDRGQGSFRDEVAADQAHRRRARLPGQVDDALDRAQTLHAEDQADEERTALVATFLQHPRFVVVHARLLAGQVVPARASVRLDPDRDPGGGLDLVSQPPSRVRVTASA